MLGVRDANMIRKAIIVLLTLAAGSVAVLWATNHCSLVSPQFVKRNVLGSYTYYRNSRECCYVSSQVGWVRLGVFSFPRSPELPLSEYDARRLYTLLTSPGPYDGRTTNHFGGLLGTYNLTRGASYRKGIAVPHWLLCALLLMYPAASLIRGPLRRRRRIRKGLCLHCGYNLKGNTSGKCSECGMGFRTDE